MRAFSRYVWLDARMTDAVRSSYRSGHPGWDEYRFARAAARDIQSLGDSGDGLCSATLLVKAVVDLLIRAHLARLGAAAATSTSSDECWASLREQPFASPIPSHFSSEQLELIASVLSNEGSRFLTQQPLRQLRLIASTMRDLAQILLEPLDAEAMLVKRVHTQRWLRVSALALLVVVAPSLLWRRTTERHNLALNKSVSVEQPAPDWVKDPRRLVDGNRDELAFHTIAAAKQRVTIDLGASQLISRVTAYNRLDCCQERAAPISIDVSEDGKLYRTVAERKEPFPVSFTVDFKKTKARFVRLTNLKDSYFHLNEVEVY